MGSCFAQELARWLDAHTYNRLPHHWGVIYNPASMAQIIQYSAEPEAWQPAEPFWSDSTGYYDPYRKSDDHSGPVRLGQTESEAIERFRAHQHASLATLSQADLAVLTLGLTELWRHRTDHRSFFAVPPPAFYNSKQHEFHNLTFDEVRDHLTYVTRTLSRLNPAIQIIISVSPIPLSISFRPELGPYVATQFSKSVLHAAVLEHVSEYPNAHYMPSYEIATNDRLRFFDPDGRHVNRLCVSTIMQAFEHLFVC